MGGSPRPVPQPPAAQRPRIAAPIEGLDLRHRSIGRHSIPKGGALLMGLMGTAGTLSIQFVLPGMGSIFDRTKVQLAGGEAAFKSLKDGPELDRILGIAAQTSFRYVAILPAILLLIFAGIWLYDRARGGYRPEKL